ncbi:MAG: HNH endonuclease signature motif containing protein [Acidimicrobiales bacterium]
MLFDGPGRPIWVGRDERNATIAQWRALIARDRGCVGCGADPNRCEAHHIVFWEHWGRTDIDNLVLVCTRCHHDLHHRGHTLRRTNGRWHIDTPNGPSPPGKPNRNRRRGTRDRNLRQPKQLTLTA